ncbi:MAG: thiamine pyrophosphate-dependent dehydrogenase E1 component subunit alpha [Thermoleophilia bacterium]|nr:thiamine pyrophosphate-dependent dehydrogenase E1 component subunit alpha [Thermoleophilia bacterium]
MAARTKQATAEPAEALPWGDSADLEDFAAAYRRMLLIRKFELATQRAFEKGQVHGTTHLCIGQEAVPVGVCAALEPGDQVVGTYRGHGLALAKGTDPTALFAEMMGRAGGTCGGRAGSMNIIDRPIGLMGCYGIVGGSIAAAIGLGLAGRGSGRVAVADFGDGAVNQAYFAECVNFVAVYDLPVVFVCENNGYGEFTAMEAVTAGGDLCRRAEAFGVATAKVDGNDVRAVRAAAEPAVVRARAGEGPTFLECATYRHLGHSRSDPGTYRPADEVRAWKEERDPLDRARAHLGETFGHSEDEIAAVDSDVDAEISAALEAALAQPYPEPPEEWP